MTRRSKRELERAVDGLDDGGDLEDAGGAGIVYKADGGGYVDPDGNPVPTDDAGNPDVPTPEVGPVIILQGVCAGLVGSDVPDAAVGSTGGGDE